jgi:hypothetical protein
LYFPNSGEKKEKTIMDGFKELDCWGENEVHIEDLDAPEKSLGFFFFSLEKKVRAAARFRTHPVALVFIVCLLALILPGSAHLSPAVHAPFSAAQQKQACFVLVVDSTSTTSAGTTWTSNTVFHLQPGFGTVYACSMSPGRFGSKTPQP